MSTKLDFRSESVNLGHSPTTLTKDQTLTLVAWFHVARSGFYGATQAAGPTPLDAGAFTVLGPSSAGLGTFAPRSPFSPSSRHYGK